MDLRRLVGLAVLVIAASAESMAAAVVHTYGPWRLASAVEIGRCIAASQLGSLIGAPLGYSALRMPAVFGAGLAVLAAGIALAVLGTRIHQAFFDPLTDTTTSRS